MGREARRGKGKATDLYLLLLPPRSWLGAAADGSTLTGSPRTQLLGFAPSNEGALSRRGACSSARVAGAGDVGWGGGGATPR